MIKAEAATVNSELGVVAAPIGAAIRQAADEIVRGEMADQFPVDVFQTGSGTSTNMNLNEVHRQSGVGDYSATPCIPTITSTPRSRRTTRSHRRRESPRCCNSRPRCCPRSQSLRQSLIELADRHVDTVKMARTHLMDAVPMTFGQEVGGWARSIELSAERITTLLPRLSRAAARRNRRRYRPERAGRLRRAALPQRLERTYRMHVHRGARSLRGAVEPGRAGRGGRNA